MKNRHPEISLDISIARSHALHRATVSRAKKLVDICFRNNTILEDLHGAGKISEAEMKELMVATVDNVYTFLSMTKAGIAPFPEPEDWQAPKLNKALVLFSMRLRGLSVD